MPLSDVNKLNTFAAEAFAEAERTCAEIKAVMDKEREEKLQSGRKVLLSEIREAAAEKTARIRKENAFAVSRRNTELRHEYLLKIDSMSDLVTEGVRKKLEEFAESKEYPDYLKRIAVKILGAGYPDGGIIYHAERDARHMDGVKGALAAGSADVSKIEFKPDAGIKAGGLKFHPNGRNIRINVTLDDKLERSAATLDRLISEHVHDIGGE